MKQRKIEDLATIKEILSTREYIYSVLDIFGGFGGKQYLFQTRQDAWAWVCTHSGSMVPGMLADYEDKCTKEPFRPGLVKKIENYKFDYILSDKALSDNDLEGTVLYLFYGVS